MRVQFAVVLVVGVGLAANVLLLAPFDGDDEGAGQADAQGPAPLRGATPPRSVNDMRKAGFVGCAGKTQCRLEHERCCTSARRVGGDWRFTTGCVGWELECSTARECDQAADCPDAGVCCDLGAEHRCQTECPRPARQLCAKNEECPNDNCEHGMCRPLVKPSLRLPRKGAKPPLSLRGPPGSD